MDAPQLTRPEQGEVVTQLWRHVNRLADVVEAHRRTLDDLDQRVPRRRRMDAKGGGWNLRGTWADETAYAVDDVVIVIGAGQGTYVCRVAHTSDDAANAPWLGEIDGTAGIQYWQLLPSSAVGVWL